MNTIVPPATDAQDASAPWTDEGVAFLRRVAAGEVYTGVSRFCSVPMQVLPDEDLADHCGLCDAIMFYGYDAGAGQARKWVAP